MDAHHKRGHQCARVSRVCIRRCAAAHTPQRNAGQPRQTYPARFDAPLVHGLGLNGTLMGFNFLGSPEPDGRRSASHKYQSRRGVCRSKDNGCGSLRPPRGCGRLLGSVRSELHLRWTRILQPRSRSCPCFTFNQSVEKQANV